MEKIKTKRIVLGEGETIGHKHVLQSDLDMEVSRDDNSIQLMLNSVGILTHDEHDRILLTPGRYRSYHQVEFNPLDESVAWIYD